MNSISKCGMLNAGAPAGTVDRRADECLAEGIISAGFRPRHTGVTEMTRLNQDFFDRDTVTVARELVGKYLVRLREGETLACRITETEAYRGPVDKACHAYPNRRTRRTEPLFAAPGHVYVYLIYGLHHCLNLVTEPEGTPCAVLIRGAVPRLGTDRICQLRFGKTYSALSAAQRRNLLNGPGKLCKGLDITRKENGSDLTAGGALYVTDSLAELHLPEEAQPEQIHVGKRIGIDYAEEAADFPWRFWCETD